MLCRILILLGLMFSSVVLAETQERVQRFAFEPTKSGEQIVTVTTDSSSYVLELRSNDFDSTVDWANSKRRSVQFYEGHLQGDPDAWARVTLYDDQFYGLVKYQGSYLTLSSYDIPDDAKERPDFRPEVQNRSFVEINDFQDTLASGQSFDTVITIGIVVDHLYDQAFNGNGVAHALGITYASDAILRDNLNLALKLDAVVLTSDEDYSNEVGATTQQLIRFREFRDSTSALPADLGFVHFFSGSSRNGNSAIGRAYINTVCSPSGLDVGVSVNWPRNEATLMVHELGHNLGSLHDTVIGCETGPRHIMYPTINSSQRFSQCSLDRIRSTIETGNCFIDVVDLALAARQINQEVVFQVSNLEDTEATDVELNIESGVSLLAASELPSGCAMANGSVRCNIPTLFASETVDLSFPVTSNFGSITARVGGGFDMNPDDDSVVVNLSNRPLNNTNGLCIDPDGDGFGFSDEGSCRTNVPVLDTDEERPSFNNVQTGIPVNLVRAFWNPAEFVGQAIECVPNFWSSDDGTYLENSASLKRYQHSLGEGQTASGIVQVATFASSSEEGDIEGTTIEEFDWRIENGRYIGPAPIARSSYIQIVDEANGRINATRSWTGDISFDLCRSFPDTSSFFVPSGTINTPVAGVCVDTPPRNDGFGWNGIETCRVDADLDVTGSRSLIVNSVQGDLSIDGVLDEPLWQSATTADTGGTALRSGVTILGLDALQLPSWRLGHDSSYIYLAIEVPDETPVTDSDELLWHDDSVEIFFDGGFQRNQRYDPDDTQLVLRGTGERTGIVVRPVVIEFARSYNNTDQQYTYEMKILKSSLQLGAGEFGIEIQVNNDFDGGVRDSKLGWAGTEGMDVQWFDLSIIGHACFDNGGSTGNCVLGGVPQPEPQPQPQPEPPTQQCIDVDPVGDGWGWNGTASCRVAAIPQPPQPEPPTQQCIDVDPVGDGWGWNGTASCRVGVTPQPPQPEPPTQQCIDTDPVGDGWGWDGVSSCRVAAQPARCIDTDPVGDGWGWDGITSCRI